MIGELKAAVDLPIHLHTHDTSGNGLLTYKQAIDAGVDIIDTAVASMRWFNKSAKRQFVILCIKWLPRHLRTDIEGMESLSHYWSTVRTYYSRL